jgi:hypothetical protein
MVGGMVTLHRMHQGDTGRHIADRSCPCRPVGYEVRADRELDIPSYVVYYHRHTLYPSWAWWGGWAGQPEAITNASVYVSRIRDAE